MEIVVTGRNTEIADRFRTHVEGKLAKVEQLAPKAQRVEVELTHERNPRQSEVCERVEITVRDRGPVIRAEAKGSDRYGALDLAAGKLLERLRRARDRRKDRHRNHHRRNGGPVVADTPHIQEPVPQPDEAPGGTPVPPREPGESVEAQLGDSPVVVRQKLHEADPMTVDQALYEMELVGHPFYLFIDADTGQPCVVYHRHGWTYGVIRLNTVVDEGAGEVGPRDEGLPSRSRGAHESGAVVDEGAGEVGPRDEGLPSRSRGAHESGTVVDPYSVSANGVHEAAARAAG